MKMEQIFWQIREIAKQHQVKKIVLFGSRARGRLSGEKRYRPGNL